ncbi:hypothetical protein ACJJTC_001277 [Scirpophaga incertulas]
MGNLNTCLIKDDGRSSSFKDALAAHDLSILASDATHFFPNCKPSLIDLAIVANNNLINKCKSGTLLRRNFRDIDVPLLRQDAVNLIVRVKHMPAPWLTVQIRSLMAKRDKAKSKYRRNRTDGNLLAYKKLRNTCNRSCRDARRRYIHGSLKDASPGETFLGRIGVGKTLDELYTSNLDLDAINTHFSTPPVRLDDNTKASTITFLIASLPADAEPFQFLPVTEAEVGCGNKLRRRRRTIVAETSPAFHNHHAVFTFSLSRTRTDDKQTNILAVTAEPAANSERLNKQFIYIQTRL